MKRGTRVGQAYVALSVDGSGINEDIASSFDDVDFKQLGDDNGKKYADNIRRHLESVDKDFKGVLDRMGKAIDTDSALGQGISKQVAQAFDDGKLDDLIRKVGRESGVNFGHEFDKIVKTSVLDTVEKAMQDSARSGNGLDISKFVRTADNGNGQIDFLGSISDEAVAKATRAIEKLHLENEKVERLRVAAEQKIEAEREKAFNAGGKAQISYFAGLERARIAAERKVEAQREKAFNAGGKAQIAYFANLERVRIAAERKVEAERERAFNAGGKAQIGYFANLERARIATEKRIAAQAAKEDRDLWKVRNASAKAFAKFRADLERGVVDEFGRKVSRNGKKNFGLTSIDDWLLNTRFRNNAINILAKSLGGLIHGFERVAIVGKDFVGNMQRAEEGASIFGKISAGFGAQGAEGAGVFSKIFAAIAESGPGAVVAIAAVALGLSILVSVANALLAIVVALAATIASALVGALAVAGAGILAVVAAGGLLTLAFTSMTDAQKKALRLSFRPLHEELAGIGQIVLHDLIPSFSTWSSNLQHALLLAVPAAQVMGKAFGEAGSTLTREFSGPGFRLFASTLAVYLPGIVKNLAEAFGHFLNGTLAVFSAILPYVLQFSHYLEEVGDRFTKWATSAKGQNSIVDFVDRALNSLHSLWMFLGALGGLISAVLFSSSGQNAGNNIFDSMTLAVQRFTNYLSQDDRLDRWFAQGVTFAESLGQSIKTIAQLLQSLNESGTIDGIARLVDIGAGAYKWFSKLPDVIQGMIFPLKGIADLIGFIGNILGSGASGKGGVLGSQSDINSFGATLLGPLGSASAPPRPKAPSVPSLSSLINSGTAALNATSKKNGGFRPNYVNPYTAWANSLIKQGPSVSAQIRNAILSINKAAAAGIRSASQSTDVGSVQSGLDSVVSSITTTAEQTINSAQSALNSAAQSLANATSKNAAKHALVQVRKAQKNLQAALNDQKRINAAAKILNGQKVLTESNVVALLSGLKATNATLADYAEARNRVADLLSDANAKLTAALQLRDSYKTQVADSIKSFGSLLSAQAQTIDGIEQALTANDVTSNLQDKLTQIQKFQSDLQLLLAQGLSNDAYKQIVDAGVEQGTTIADALIAGGVGAIQNTNSLVSQINGIADTLGSETSSRLYQAGVDAAQGLVDGLTSLSAQLDAAAYALGTSIALAVQKALGIKSPSRVLREMMGYVGDGAVLGLNDQHDKVGTAASALASKIAVSPTASTYSSSAPGSGVSGNQPDPRFRDLIVQTPTTDPKAVAHEVLNEVTGRLP